MPEVKRFLREPGGADLYPALEIEWKRGQDPHLEIRRCRTPRDSKRPAGEPGAGGVSDSELLETVYLSRFGHGHLHYLLQCNGIEPSRRTPATPVAASAAAACEMLPDPFWGTWMMWLAFAAALLPLVLLFRCLASRPGGTARLLGAKKFKREEDTAPKDATACIDSDAI